jgi:hypothetical protein
MQELYIESRHIARKAVKSEQDAQRTKDPTIAVWLKPQHMHQQA